MSLDHVYISHKNSLNIEVVFEHTWEKATTNALVNSGVTKNFVNIWTAEHWGMLRKVLPQPWPIVNIDGTKNKVEMVMKAYILKVLHNKY